jgi:hypothetical protein
MAYFLLILSMLSDAPQPVHASPEQWAALKRFAKDTGVYARSDGWNDDYRAEHRWVRNQVRIAVYYSPIKRYLPGMEAAEEGSRLAYSHYETCLRHENEFAELCALGVDRTVELRWWGKRRDEAWERYNCWSMLKYVHTTSDGAVQTIKTLVDKLNERYGGVMPQPVPMELMREVP